MPIEYLMWLPLAAVSVALYATLAAAALVSMRHSLWVSVAARRAWAVLIVLIPVAGAVLWLLASHRRNLAFPEEVDVPAEGGNPGDGAGDDSEGKVQGRKRPTKSLR